MKTMLALFAILFLLGALDHPSAIEHKCPILKQETWPITEPWIKLVDESGKHYEKRLSAGVKKDGYLTFSFETGNATTSEIELYLKQVGTSTDKEAVEYNKRVRECQTLNGEF